MAKIPDAAVRAAVEARQGVETATATEQARAMLEAAAPVMAEAVARRILAHMEAHGPYDPGFAGSVGGTLRRAWRRHFGIAAQVAALAFSAPEDIRREAAAALNRGDYAACWLDDAGRSIARTREEGNRDH